MPSCTSPIALSESSRTRNFEDSPREKLTVHYCYLVKMKNEMMAMMAMMALVAKENSHVE